jgi:hypothetical protein
MSEHGHDFNYRNVFADRNVDLFRFVLNASRE